MGRTRHGGARDTPEAGDEASRHGDHRLDSTTAILTMVTEGGYGNARQ